MRHSRYSFIILLALFFSVTAQAHLLADDDTIPTVWDGQHWLVMPLNEADNEAYYEAHQSSASYLYHALGWGWPTRKITREINLSMVRHHINQHQLRDSFTYVVRAQGKQAIVGAIYINQVNRERRHVPNFNAAEFMAEMTFWFTEETETSVHAASLLSEIFAWLQQEWQFSAVLLPVHKNYNFIHERMDQLEYKPFSTDADTSEQLYRLP